MLVLTRKPGEVIRIGNDIEILVTELNGQRVKLGVAAPQDVRILRSECAPYEHQRDERKASDQDQPQGQPGCAELPAVRNAEPAAE